MIFINIYHYNPSGSRIYYVSTYIDANTNSIKMQVETAYTSSDGYITIKYTKTTD